MLKGAEAVQLVQELEAKYERIAHLEERSDELGKALFTAARYVENINVLAELENSRKAVESEIERTKERRKEELWSILRVPTPAKVSWRSEVRHPASRALYEEGVKLFVSLTNHPAIEGKEVIFGRAYPDIQGRIRSGYYGGSLIRMSASDDVPVVAHELGHWLEDMDRNALKKSLSFLRRRAGSDNLENLTRLTGNPNYFSFR